MAETVGFEPTRQFPAYSLSRGAPSTTRPRLQLPTYRKKIDLGKPNKDQMKNIYLDFLINQLI